MICDGNKIIAVEDGEKLPFDISSSSTVKDFTLKKAKLVDENIFLLDIMNIIAFFHTKNKLVGCISLEPTNILLVNSSEGTRGILSSIPSSSLGSQEEDLCAAGFLLHYVWTSGINAYGAIQKITNDCLKNNLIERMTDSKSGINVKDVLCDLAFWSKQKRLSFMMKVSDILELKQKKHADAIEDKKSQIIGLSWKLRLPLVIQKKIDIDSKKRRTYYTTEVKDLLRVIRNLAHHFHELAPDVQAALGPVDDLADFWTSTFPLLLPSVYHAMAPFKGDTNCARIKMYYP